MIGTVVRIGTTELLKEMGTDRETAELAGRVIGLITTVVTCDVLSASLDASLTVADHVSATVDLHASYSS